MKFTLYTFSKKTNSTKRPDQPGTEISGQLVEPFSLDKLDVKFRLNNTANAPTYNYCFADTHLGSRHYFITNWSYDTGVWIAHMEEDHLATYKTKIGNSEQYVVRAASEYNDAIPDTRYGTTVNTTPYLGTGIWDNTTSKWISPLNYMQSRDYGQERHIVLVMNLRRIHYVGEPEKVYAYEMETGLTYLVCNAREFVGFFGAAAISEAIRDIVVAAYFLPTELSAAYYSKQVDEVGTGNQMAELTVPLYRVKGGELLTTKWNITIPVKSSDAEYKNGPLYTKMSLQFAPFGTPAIDSSLYTTSSTTSVYCKAVVDPLTGECNLYAGLNDSTANLVASADVRSPLYFSGNVDRFGQDVVKAFGALAAIGANVYTGNYIGAAAIAANTVGEFYQNDSKIPQVNSTAGSQLIDPFPRLLTYKATQVSRDIDRFGAPLMQIKTIRTLEGFVQCSDVHLDFDIPEVEKNAIARLMESGFYYE